MRPPISTRSRRSRRRFCFASAVVGSVSYAKSFSSPSLWLLHRDATPTPASTWRLLPYHGHRKGSLEHTPMHECPTAVRRQPTPVCMFSLPTASRRAVVVTGASAGRPDQDGRDQGTVWSGGARPCAPHVAHAHVVYSLLVEVRVRTEGASVRGGVRSSTHDAWPR